MDTTDDLRGTRRSCSLKNTAEPLARRSVDVVTQDIGPNGEEGVLDSGPQRAVGSSPGYPTIAGVKSPGWSVDVVRFPTVNHPTCSQVVLGIRMRPSRIQDPREDPPVWYIPGARPLISVRSESPFFLEPQRHWRSILRRTNNAAVRSVLLPTKVPVQLPKNEFSESHSDR
jgi:hypothetical protein